MKKVLNVGGNNKAIPLPAHFSGWEHLLLDIDPRGNPDVVCDARKLDTLEPATFDAIYCSHNLEHYHRHDAVKVLAGFAHVLKTGGFIHVRVPDVGEVMRRVVVENLDIDDVLYQSQSGPILVRDVIYGYGLEIERSGNDFYAHKTGFTQKSLATLLYSCGFPWIFMTAGNLEIGVFAFVDKPSVEMQQLLNLKVPEEETVQGAA